MSSSSASGRQRRGLRRRNVDFDAVAFVDDRVRFHGDGAADADAALRDQPLELRSRMIRQHRDEHPVQALAVVIGGYVEFERHGQAAPSALGNLLGR